MVVRERGRATTVGCSMASVELRDIVASQDRTAVMDLRMGPGQDRYLDSMESIFAEADLERRAMASVGGPGR